MRIRLPSVGEPVHFPEGWALVEKITNEFHMGLDEFVDFYVLRFPDGHQCRLTSGEMCDGVGTQLLREELGKAGYRSDGSLSAFEWYHGEPLYRGEPLHKDDPDWPTVKRAQERMAA